MRRQTESEKVSAILHCKPDHREREITPKPDKREANLALVKKPRSRGGKPKKIGGHIVARYGGRKSGLSHMMKKAVKKIRDSDSKSVENKVQSRRERRDRR